MIELIRDLFQHQTWADNALLAAVDAHPASRGDERMLSTLHHIVLVHRAFLAQFLARPFDVEAELRPVSSFDVLPGMFDAAHAELTAFAAASNDDAMPNPIAIPWFPGAAITLGDALMQVAMHSHNHRGQCLTRLRENGAAPPMLDYIIWVKDGRP